MSEWWIRNSVTGIRYGQDAARFYWDSNINPGATFDPSLNTYDLALPNCTTYAYGRVKEMGAPGPISGWHNAGAWHYYLINGWTYVSYALADLEVGDIVEWESGNHVAVVEYIDDQNQVYVSQSYYCDDNGQATNNTRSWQLWGSTAQSVDNYGYSHWPTRYFNYGLVTSAALGYPDYILKNPVDYDPVQFKYFIKRSKKRRKIYV